MSLAMIGLLVELICFVTALFVSVTVSPYGGNNNIRRVASWVMVGSTAIGLAAYAVVLTRSW